LQHTLVVLTATITNNGNSSHQIDLHAVSNASLIFARSRRAKNTNFEEAPKKTAGDNTVNIFNRSRFGDVPFGFSIGLLFLSAPTTGVIFLCPGGRPAKKHTQRAIFLPCRPQREMERKRDSDSIFHVKVKISIWRNARVFLQRIE
jgi:hypothetical protein